MPTGNQISYISNSFAPEFLQKNAYYRHLLQDYEENRAIMSKISI